MADPPRPHGVRARAAWYRRRILRRPITLTARHNAGWYTAVVDPPPPWRRPQQPTWQGWHDIGATDDTPPGLGGDGG